MEFAGKLTLADVLPAGLATFFGFGVVMTILGQSGVLHAPTDNGARLLLVLIGATVLAQVTLLHVLPRPRIRIAAHGVDLRMGFSHAFVPWNQILSIEDVVVWVAITTVRGRSIKLERANFGSALPDIARALLAARARPPSADPIIIEPPRGVYYLAVHLFVSAIFGAPLALLLTIGLSAVPGVGPAAVQVTPGWLFWAAASGALFAAQHLSESQQKLRIDANGLGCWLGSGWKEIPWDSIQKIHLEHASTRGIGRPGQWLHITDDKGTFTYAIRDVDASGEAFQLMYRRLGGRATRDHP